MKKNLLILILLNSIPVFAQYSSPESVTYDTLTKRYFISNTTSGKILQRDTNGSVTDFVNVGSSIHGVTIHGNTIYVCNQTRIKGYDLTTAAEVFSVTLVPSTFLNDLAIDENGIMYISDFTSRRIHKLNINTSQYWIYVTNTTNTPNGVYIDSPRNRLLICCWGANAPIRAVNLTDSTISTVTSTNLTNCDGITLDKYENVYVSSWGIQAVVKFDINFINAPVKVITGLASPADIYFNKTDDTLAVPSAGSNTVTFHYLHFPSGINSSPNIPESFLLYQNYPNPFNPVTKIKFDINHFESGQTGKFKLAVYDLNGKEIKTLFDRHLTAGNYEVEFNGENLAAGIYFYKLESENISLVRKMILIK